MRIRYVKHRLKRILPYRLASSAKLERTVIAFEARLKEAETVSTKTVNELKRVDGDLAQLRKEFEAEKEKTRKQRNRRKTSTYPKKNTGREKPERPT